MLPRSGFTLVSSTSSSLSNARGWEMQSVCLWHSFILFSHFSMGRSLPEDTVLHKLLQHASFPQASVLQELLQHESVLFFLRFLKHVLTESPPLSWCAQLWPAVGLLRTWNCLCLSWVSSLKPLLGWRQFCEKSHLTCTWHTRTMKTWYKCCPAVSIEYRYLTL